MLKHICSALKLKSPLQPPVPSNLIVTALPLFTFDPLTASWLPNPTKKLPTTTSIPLRDLRILTWNVDFMSPKPQLRMHALLAHLESVLGGEPPPTTLLLQEIHPQALDFLLESIWVREKFAVTDTVLARNSPTYGTVTLLTKDLARSVGYSFRVSFMDSKYGRDALFVDLKIMLPRPVAALAQNKRRGGKKDEQPSGILRVGNTHLESLGPGGAFRKTQLATISDILSVPEVYAGVVGGDMNAISEDDQALPRQKGLRDLWVGEGGETWGYQPPRAYPPGRLDKILAVGSVGLVQNTQSELVGVGSKTEPSKGGEQYYISDHYGLMSTIQVKTSV